ncbi:chaplin family protein, partial [Cellulomonas pakistanensis]|uniref:chaplin family protein n=1 Tax=Cellulomonas pakistanensis TaxID=992287 RepID=UPI001940AD35
MRRAVHTALLTGGIVVAGAVSAHAADDTGILSGLGIEAPVDVAVDVSGLAAGVLGDATTTAAPAAPAPAAPAPAPAASAGGGASTGVASGTAVAAPVSVPVDVSTVAVGVLGDASATSAAPAAAPAPQPAPAAVVEQGDAEGVASGTAVAAPVHVPVAVDGVALGVLGDASTTSTGGTVPAGASGPTTTVEAGDPQGVGSGTSVAAPITIPVTIGDVALGLLGDASTQSTGGTGTGSSGAPTTTVGGGSSDGLLSGIGAASPISVPITVGDVSLGLLGDATTDSGTGSTG